VLSNVFCNHPKFVIIQSGAACTRISRQTKVKLSSCLTRRRSRHMFSRALRQTAHFARIVGSRHASSTTDSIVMRDMSFFARHGALAPERQLGQKFLVNVELSVDLRPAGASDDLKDTVDYARAWSIVRDVIERGETMITIEAVAERSAAALLQEFRAVQRCVVSVDKPHVAIEGELGSLGVRIIRERA